MKKISVHPEAFHDFMDAVFSEAYSFVSELSDKVGRKEADIWVIYKRGFFVLGKRGRKIIVYASSGKRLHTPVVMRMLLSLAKQEECEEIEVYCTSASRRRLLKRVGFRDKVVDETGGGIMEAKVING